LTTAFCRGVHRRAAIADFFDALDGHLRAGDLDGADRRGAITPIPELLNAAAGEWIGR
jgi:hypothetical protein